MRILLTYVLNLSWIYLHVPSTLQPLKVWVPNLHIPLPTFFIELNFTLQLYSWPSFSSSISKFAFLLPTPHLTTVFFSLPSCSCSFQRWYVITPILSIPGQLLARACSSFTRSTRWSMRCASILIWSWVLNQASSKHLKTWLVKILLVQGHTPPMFFKTFQSLLWCPPIPSSAPISQGCSLCMCVVASKAQ